MVNIFLVHTEYHVLMTVRIISALYRNDQNVIFYTPGRISLNTGNNDYDLGLEFHCLPAVNYGVAQTIKQMMAYSPDNFFCFQNNSSDNIYLFYHLQKKKIKTILVQDGLKPYPIWHRKRLPLVIIKETFEFYRQMVRRHSVIPSVFFQSYVYGSLRYIDELWLEYPDKFPHKTKKNIVKIPDFNDVSINTLLKLFNYTPTTEFDNNILYIGQSFRSKEMRLEEIEIIKQIIQQNNKKIFFYKPHPLSSQEQLDAISEIDGVKIFNRRIPVELQLLNIRNGIIISPWSTALLTKNGSCRFFWIFTLFKSLKKGTQMEILNPTNHIITASSIEEIYD